MKTETTKRGLTLTLTLLIAAFNVVQTSATGKDKKAEEILKNYVLAIGGEQSVNSINNLLITSELTFIESGVTVKKEIVTDKTNRYYCKATAPGMGEMFKAFDGKVCWELYPSGLRVAGENEKQTFLNESAFLRYAKWANILDSYKYLGLLEIEGHELHAISVTTIYGATETWYFNKTDSLLARIEEQLNMPQGKVKVVTTFEDYKEINGVKHSFVQHIIMPEKTNKISLTGILYNQVIDEKIYALPSENK